MRPPEFGLPATLRWFQDQVLERRPAESRSVRERILPTPTMSPEASLRIYAESGRARFVSALEGDFPAVARRLGPRAFRALCLSFLEAHPSRSRSLNPLGRKLPEFLGAMRGKEGLRDLARLEVAMSEVFDEREVAPLGPADFAAMSEKRRIGLRLRFVPAFRLLELDHDVNRSVDAVRRGRPLPPLPRRRSWIAVYRKEFRVCRLDLERPAFAALDALRRGMTVGDAARAGSELGGGLTRAFGIWSSEGFFAALA